jgi:hypothetical protein
MNAKRRARTNGPALRGVYMIGFRSDSTSEKLVEDRLGWTLCDYGRKERENVVPESVSPSMLVHDADAAAAYELFDVVDEEAVGGD